MVSGDSNRRYARSPAWGIVALATTLTVPGIAFAQTSVDPTWDYGAFTGTGLARAVAGTCSSEDSVVLPQTAGATDSSTVTCPAASATAVMSTRRPPGGDFRFVADASRGASTTEARASLSAWLPFQVNTTGHYVVSFAYERTSAPSGRVVIATATSVRDTIFDSDVDGFTPQTVQSVELGLAAGFSYGILVELESVAASGQHVRATVGEIDFVLQPPDEYVVSPEESIQDAIDTAYDGDIITLADGVHSNLPTYSNSDPGLRLYDKTLTLRSASGDPNACVIDASGIVGDATPLFIGGLFRPNRTTVRGIGFRGGRQEASSPAETLGGGVDVRWTLTNVLFENCIVAENAALGGGGIEVNLGAGDVLGEDFDAVCTFRRCLVVQNEATSGTTTRSGGGFLVRSNSHLTLENCTIADNSSASTGGAIDCDGSAVVIDASHTIFIGNTAAQSQWDDVDLSGAGSISFDDCIFVSGGTGDGNVSGTPVAQDPEFCEPSSCPGGFSFCVDDYSLCALSPAAPFISPTGLIGARGVGPCGACGEPVRIPDDYPTILAAVAAVADGDVIKLANGTFTGPEEGIDVPKAIEISSISDDPTLCIIDGGGVAVGFSFEAPQGSFFLRGITVQNTFNVNPGGAVDARMDGTIENCRFVDNEAQAGAGLELRGGASVTVIDTDFRRNTVAGTSDRGGGAIYVNDANASFQGCVITDNSSQLSGGGIWVRAKSLASVAVTFDRCTIANNIAENGGGDGFYVDTQGAPATVTLDHTILWGGSLDTEDAYLGDEATFVGQCSMLRRNRIAGLGNVLDQGFVAGPPRFCGPSMGDYRVAANSRATPTGHTCGSGEWIGALTGTCGDRAVTFTVRETPSGDFPFIQDAIDASVDGDVVELDDGVYGPGHPRNRDLSVVDKSIAIVSATMDSASCIIDGEGVDPSWGFVVEGAGSGQTLIRGLTIRNMRLTGTPRAYGSALHVGGLAAARIERSVVTGNRALAGGAVEVTGGGALEVADCRLENNRATAPDLGGGAFHVSSGVVSSLSVDGCVVAGNAASVTPRGAGVGGRGGALFVASDVPSGTSIVFHGCTIADNVADGGGTAIFSESNAGLDVNEAIVADTVFPAGDLIRFADVFHATCSVLGAAPTGGSPPVLDNVVVDDPLFCATGGYALCEESPALAQACAPLIGAVADTCQGCLQACTDPDTPDAPNTESVCGGVRVTWTGSDQVGIYQILADGSQIGSVPSTTGTLEFVHLVPPGDGTPRAYALKAFAPFGDCSSALSGATTGTPGLRPLAPQIASVVSECDGVTLTWSTVSGADAYRIIDVDASTPLLEVPHPVGETSATARLSGLTAPVTLVVRAVRGTACASAVSNEVEGVPIITPTVPQGLVATAECGAVRLDWSPVPGAVRYNVYRWELGEPMLLGSTTTPTFTDPREDPSEQLYAASATTSGCESALTATVTGAPVSAPPPPLVAPTSGSDVQRPIVLDWDPIPDAIDHIVEVATSASFGASTVWRDSLGAAVTSATVTRLLAPETDHWWRVTTRTTCGVGQAADAFHTSSATLAIDAEAAATSDGARWQIEDLIGDVVRVTALWRLGGDRSPVANSRTTCDRSGSLFTCALAVGANALRGVEYTLELDFGSTILTFGDPDAPERIAVRQTDIQAPLQTVREYRMISAPASEVDGAAVIDAIEGAFGVDDPHNWKLRRWVPTDADHGAYEVLGSSAPPAMDPGGSYWLITKDAGTWQIGGLTTWPDLPAAPASPGSLAVELEPGWNMVGNPFAYPIALAYDALGLGGATYGAGVGSLVDSIWVHDPGAPNGYAIADPSTGRLDVWDGCWIRNRTSSPLMLTLPAVAVGTTRIAAERDASTLGWSMAIDARAAAEHSRVVLATASEASAARDVQLPPPDPGRSLVLRLVPEGSDPNGSEALYLDTRGPGEPRVWTLVIESPGGDVELSWDGSTAIHGGPTSLVVVDPAGRLWSADRAGSLRLPAGRHILDVRGDGELHAPAARSGLWLVARPNPFAASTAISYTLPAAGTARLDIFDVRGRHVYREMLRATGATTYGFVWQGTATDGHALAAGIYFARLRFMSAEGGETADVHHRLTILK